MRKILNHFLWTITLIIFATSVGAQEKLSIYRQDGTYYLVDVKSGDQISQNVSPDKIIQKAVDALKKSGGEIELSRGTYLLDSPVKISEGISLSGQGRGTELKASKDLEYLIQLHNVKDITVSRIAVSPGNSTKGSGISIKNVNNGLIENVIVFGFSNYGL